MFNNVYIFTHACRKRSLTYPNTTPSLKPVKNLNDPIFLHLKNAKGDLLMQPSIFKSSMTSSLETWRMDHSYTVAGSICWSLGKKKAKKSISYKTLISYKWCFRTSKAHGLLSWFSDPKMPAFWASKSRTPGVFQRAKRRCWKMRSIENILLNVEESWKRLKNVESTFWMFHIQVLLAYVKSSTPDFTSKKLKRMRCWCPVLHTDERQDNAMHQFHLFDRHLPRTKSWWSLGTDWETWNIWAMGSPYHPVN